MDQAVRIKLERLAKKYSLRLWELEDPFFKGLTSVVSEGDKVVKHLGYIDPSRDLEPQFLELLKQKLKR